MENGSNILRLDNVAPYMAPAQSLPPLGPSTTLPH